MKYCPNCGTQLPDEAAFCRQCGSQFQNQGNWNQNSQNYSPQNNGSLNQGVQVLETVEEAEGGMKPVTAIICMIATIIIESIIAAVFDLHVDQIMTYVLNVGAGVAILYFMGASLTWTEKNGKTSASKAATIVGIILLVLLAFYCFSDLYRWITD